MVVRFEDGSPAMSENPFYFVRTRGLVDTFSQELVTNVEAFAKRQSDSNQKEDTVRGGFRYALTASHAE